MFQFSAMAIGNNNNFRGQIEKNLRNTFRQMEENQVNQPTTAVEIQNRVRNEVRQQLEEQKQSFWESLKNKFKKFNRTVKITGTVTAISETSLTVSDTAGKVYTVNITDKTQLRRRFWGKATLVEFSVGNQVNVIGRWTDDNQTTIEAVLIRNLSIQRRWGVFFGTVTAKNSDNFIILTHKRDAQTVYFGPTTRFIKRNQEGMSYDELAVGHKVRVKGVWDRDLNQIIEVEEVKNFSLPPFTNRPVPTATLESTGSPTPIPSDTPIPTSTM